MAARHWKKYGRELWKDCLYLWDWVRALPEYRADYLIMKKTPARPYQLPPGRTILTALPPKDKFAESLKSKWGFYPLTNPSKKMSSDFFYQIAELFGLHNTEAGVRHLGFSYESLMGPNGKFLPHKKLPSLPERISLSINPKLPPGPASEYINEFLTQIQRLYKIRQTRSQTTWLLKKYQAGVLGNIGRTKNEIKSCITPKDWDLKVEDDKRQRIARIRRKSKKAFT